MVLYTNAIAQPYIFCYSVGVRISTYYLPPLIYYEYYLSTKKAKTSKNPRFSRAHKVKKRQKSHHSPSPKGSQKVECIKIPGIFPVFLYNMLKKALKIKREDYMPIIQNRKSIDTPALRFSYKETKGVGKFTVTVPKKAFLLATDRNRVKRQLFSIIEAEYALIKPGFSGIFSVKKGFLPKNTEDVRVLLKKANAYR